MGNYLQLMRAPAVFTALSNILAAHIILTQGAFLWPELVLLLGATAALYSGGMVLNDWFDYDTDCQQRPSRPLPSGKVSRQHALLFGAVLLIAGVSLAALAGSRSFYIALVIVALVLLYDGLLKRSNTGVFVMAGCRYFNWLLGLSLLPLDAQSWLLPLPVFIYIVALTTLSRQEESAASPNSIIAVMLTIALAGLSIIAIALSLNHTLDWRAAVVVLATGFLCYRLWPTCRDFSPTRIQQNMKLLIMTIIPLDALLVLVFGPAWWWALPVLALLPPGKMMARKMYVT